VIRVERAALPEGLRAVAYRDRDGNLVVCVSEELDSGAQRAAVVDAIRAARRVGWRAGLPPAGIAAFLAVRALLRRAVRPLKARPAAWGSAAAATATIAAAAAYFLITPPHPGSPNASPLPGPSAAAPAPPADRPPARSGPGPAALPVHAAAPGHARSGVVSQVAPSPVAPGPGATPGSIQPSPAPAGHSTSPPAAPAPAPTPSQQPTPPPPTGSDLCLTLLGAKVCLRV
jgi:hypothetical protein